LNDDDGQSIEFACRDGVTLGGRLWRRSGSRRPIVVVNPATGVLARYYHYFARFLRERGFDVLTYDYRGIGLSRPEKLRGCGYRWSDWGELDFDAALLFARAHAPGAPLLVVGHSIGGFLPGLSPNAALIDRMLTVGAQYAYWRDYARGSRMRLFMKWHVCMPAATALCGYFPGRALGWLEDLPAGVANEWSFRRAPMELSHPSDAREGILARFAAVRAPILAVAASDDDIGTAPAIRRGLSYYRNATQALVLLSPPDLGLSEIGHFGLFHARRQGRFWAESILWLRDGRNPWPQRQIPPLGDDQTQKSRWTSTGA